MPERRIAITKKVSLADISDGWDQCYAIVQPATYKDYSDFATNDLTKMSGQEQIKLEMDFVKSHFISGQIMVISASGQELADMQASDVEVSTQLANKLFAEILGMNLDPKGLPTAA